MIRGCLTFVFSTVRGWAASGAGDGFEYRRPFAGFLAAFFSNFSGASATGFDAATGWPKMTEESRSRVSGLLQRRTTMAKRETRLNKAQIGLTAALLLEMNAQHNSAFITALQVSDAKVGHPPTTRRHAGV